MKDFDISLTERPFDGSLEYEDVDRMMRELRHGRFQLIVIDAKDHESTAMGVATTEAIDKLGQDPQDEGLCDFIAAILDDMDLENRDGTYRYRGLDIHLTR